MMRDEVRKWSRNCIDVEALQGRARRAEETCRVLSKKVAALQRQLQKVQMERMNDLNSGRAVKKSEPVVVHQERKRDEANLVSIRDNATYKQCYFPPQGLKVRFSSTAIRISRFLYLFSREKNFELFRDIILTVTI